MMNFGLSDWLTLLLFVLVASYGLRFFVWLVRRYVFKIDVEERSEIFKAEFNALKEEHKEQQEKILDLEKQNKIFVESYEKTIGKLAELNIKCDALTEENKALKEQVEALKKLTEEKLVKSEKILYVVIGSSDVGLSLDLASIRAVETETGLEVQLIKDPSPESIERKLSLARREKSHVYLHMSVKSDKEGYQLGTKIVDAVWLSTILEGVLVLVVAGTDSNYIGEFLGVVPYVITMQGGVANRDAAIFSRAFWTEIGRGIGPSLALKRALARSPDGVRECVISHWEK